jgi:hypothetical protein
MPTGMPAFPIASADVRGGEPFGPVLLLAPNEVNWPTITPWEIGSWDGEMWHDHHGFPLKPTLVAAACSASLCRDRRGMTTMTACSRSLLAFSCSRRQPTPSPDIIRTQPLHITVSRMSDQRSPIVSAPYQQHFQPRRLPIAHQPNRHPQHPPEIPRAVSSL